jgi:protein involved in polysaccharide export with SLBB domain
VSTSSQATHLPGETRNPVICREQVLDWSAMTPRPLFLLLIACVLAVATACETTPTRPPVVTAPAIVSDLLGPNDVFEVRVLGEEGLSGDFRVGEDGAVIYPVLGRLEVAGKTANDLAQTLSALLADGYLNHPEVAVFVREHNSSKVAVIGQVQAPGRYSYKTGLTIVEVIAEAGGTTDRALLSTITVTRRVEGEERSYEVPFRDITLGRAPDFRLIPGDVVVVAESAIK